MFINQLESSLKDYLPNSYKKISLILSSALQAVNPYDVVKSAIIREGEQVSINGKTYYLNDYEKIYLIGIGKASILMSLGLEDILGDQIRQGIVITKYLPVSSVLPENIETIIGNHPVPDVQSLAAGKQLLSFLQNINENDLVFCLISGGGSALVTLPEDGITLNEIAELNSVLLQCGASINEINCIRKHVDRLKGGGVIQYGTSAQWITLVLSDVVSNSLDVIASGPTFPDPTTFEDACGIIENYGLVDKISTTIYQYLLDGKDGKQPETLKPGNSKFRKMENRILASNEHAAAAAKNTCLELGFDASIFSTTCQGEANLVGGDFAEMIKTIKSKSYPGQKPTCIIVGGETTVTVKGNGFGGRNLEVALSAAKKLSGLENVALITLATDGEDGPTDAAGAVVTGETFDRAAKQGLSLQDYLERNDSYHFFEQVGGLIKTGSTGTNVNDLTFLFVF